MIDPVVSVEQDQAIRTAVDDGERSRQNRPFTTKRTADYTDVADRSMVRAELLADVPPTLAPRTGIVPLVGFCPAGSYSPS